jgi:hypothetical protein
MGAKEANRLINELSSQFCIKRLPHWEQHTAGYCEAVIE